MNADFIEFFRHPLDLRDLVGQLLRQPGFTTDLQRLGADPGVLLERRGESDALPFPDSARGHRIRRQLEGDVLPGLAYPQPLPYLGRRPEQHAPALRRHLARAAAPREPVQERAPLGDLDRVVVHEVHAQAGAVALQPHRDLLAVHRDGPAVAGVEAPDVIGDPVDLDDGARHVILLFIERGAAVEIIGLGRVDCDRLRVIGDGAVEIVLGDMGGAAAHGFDSHRAGSRVAVEHARAFDARGEDVEEGFTQLVGRRSQAVPRRRLEAASLVSACDHPHSTRRHEGIEAHEIILGPFVVFDLFVSSCVCRQPTSISPNCSCHRS